MPDLFAFDRELRLEGFSFLAGVDEAGRGPLAGPVVAAAVILPAEVYINELNDSKKLPPRTRERIAAEIKKVAVDWAVGLATVGEIELFNIHGASLLAMRRAVRALAVAPQCLVVDGCFSIPDLELRQYPLTGGDGL